jgi:hypothetical protein
MVQSANQPREIAFFALLFLYTLADLAFTIAKVTYIGLAFAWLTLIFVLTLTYSGLRHGIVRCKQADWRFTLRSLLLITTFTALILGTISAIISTTR